MDTTVIQAEFKKKKALLEILKAFDSPFKLKNRNAMTLNL